MAEKDDIRRATIGPVVQASLKEDLERIGNHRT